MNPKTENTPWIQTVSGRKFPLDKPDAEFTEAHRDEAEQKSNS